MSKIYGKTYLTMQFHDENMNIVKHVLPYEDIFTESTHSDILKYLEENNNNLNSSLGMFCTDRGFNLEELVSYDILTECAIRYLRIYYSTEKILNILPSIQFNVYALNISIKKIFTCKYYNDQIFKVINIQTLPELLGVINMENTMMNNMLLGEINIENAMNNML